MHLKVCRSKRVLVLSPLKISKYKDNHPKGLFLAGTPASQLCNPMAAEGGGCEW